MQKPYEKRKKKNKDKNKTKQQTKKTKQRQQKRTPSIPGKKPLEKTPLKYSRNETMVIIAHLANAIAFA